MKSRTSIFLSAVNLLTSVLTGCALAVTDHAVAPTGPDTFTVVSHATMGLLPPETQEADKFEFAIRYCKKQGKDLETVDQRREDAGPRTMASSETEYRCVAPGGTTQ